MATDSRLSTMIRLDPELHRELKQRALDEGTTINAIATKALTAYLAITPQTTTSLVRSYGAVSSNSVSPDILSSVATTYQKGVEKLTDEYSEALRRLSGGD